MKQGINVHMPVTFKNIDLDIVTKIEFMFKQSSRTSAEPVKTSLYMADGSGDAQRDVTRVDTIRVPWDRSETYRFRSNKNFFMDTRIYVDSSEDNPETPIVPLVMSPTLFEEEIEL